MSFVTLFLAFQICNRRKFEFAWIGIRDDIEEGVWIQESFRREKIVEKAPTSGDKAVWMMPWEKKPSEPNGGREENCAAMRIG